MKCPRCARDSSGDELTCGLCGEVLRRAGAPDHFLEIEPGDQAKGAVPAAVAAPEVVSRARGAAAVVEEEPAQGVARWLRHPAAALAIGLVAFPVAKLLWIPNYMFNFLATLVHEGGHAVCAWLMGRMAIPTVGLGGGGITVWSDSAVGACLMVWAALGALAWWVRGHKGAFIAAVVACAVYPLLAFTGANPLVAIAGGVIFEIGGAAACFHMALWPHIHRQIERPLYALWGWWMLLNRGSETVLMLKDESYWQTQTVYESGLAAGLTSDLEVIRETLNVSPYPVLWSVMFLCILCLPVALASIPVRRSLRRAQGLE
ncbi:MAG: hypothetical protein HYY18_17610 [Planctomycetes bacterium]|nr:hypothetical protein [Planctomycetota bacterium]